jgi:hypothetical protein
MNGFFEHGIVREDVDLPRPEALMPIILTVAIDVGGQEQKFDQFREN